MNYTKILIVGLFCSCFLIACDDKTEDFNGPYSLVVTGATTSSPGATEIYRLAPYSNPETYKWTIEGPGEIVGATTGLTVHVSFSSVGKVTLTVTNGTDKATYPITVSDVSPDVEVVLNGTGVLRSGSKDTVYLQYPAPLVSAPTVTMLTAADSSWFNDGGDVFVSGSIGSVKKLDDMTYYFVYTASDGNGTPEVVVKNAISTADYGSDTVETAHVQLYRVDNIAPIADLAYSTLIGKKGTEVTVTATFSEPVTFADPADSALIISFSGAGVTAEDDSLSATDNPLVYTYTYTITGTGNGAVSVALSKIADLAGNDLSSTTSSGGKLIVDNTMPIVTGSAVDGGDFASIGITSTESGMGSYVIMMSGDPAPATPDDFFAASGVASGTVSLTANTTATISKLLTDGSYTVYFISQDEAGNDSTIKSVSLTMN